MPMPVIALLVLVIVACLGWYLRDVRRSRTAAESSPLWKCPPGEQDEPSPMEAVEILREYFGIAERDRRQEMLHSVDALASAIHEEDLKSTPKRTTK